MKAYGEWMYSFMYSWPRHQLEVSHQLHASGALPSVPFGQKDGWTPISIWKTYGRKKFCHYLDSNSNPFRPSHSQSIDIELVYRVKITQSGCDRIIGVVNAAMKEKGMSGLIFKLKTLGEFEGGWGNPRGRMKLLLRKSDVNCFRSPLGPWSRIDCNVRQDPNRRENRRNSPRC
jgi:hypothetical protein